MGKKRNGISTEDIKALCHREFEAARTAKEVIQDDADQALQRYNQDQYGDEKDGESKVVTSEVRDTVESILPMVLQFMVGQEAPFEFTPRDKSDVELAKQETLYTNYVLNQQNNGFLLLYTWVKDALLQKNGIVKRYWDEQDSKEREEYSNQTIAQFIQASAEDGVEVTEATVYVDEQEMSAEEFLLMSEEGLVNAEAATIDYVLERTEDISQVRVENYALENFFVQANQSSLDLKDARYVAGRDYWTVSDLRSEGIKEGVLQMAKGVSAFDARAKNALTRYEDEGGLNKPTEEDGDESRKVVEVIEHYVRADKDGDGIAELLRVLEVGGVIAECEEVDAIPFRAMTPIVNPHRFWGVSVADLVLDLQRIGTTVLRQMLNNLYLTNNPMKYVNMGALGENAQNTIDDLLNWRPGGIVRGDGAMQEVVSDMTVPFMAQSSLPVMEYLHDLKEQRTGVSRTNLGLDPNAFKENTNMVGAMQMNAAMQRIKMIARIMLETGYKGLMSDIRDLVRQHEKAERIAYIAGSFTAVDPRTWKNKRETVVKVGTGYATREEKLLANGRLLDLQNQVVQAGGMGSLVQPKNVYSALADFVELSGLHTPEKYFTDPTTLPPPPPQETPASEALQIAEAEVSVKAATNQAEIEFKYAKLKADREVELFKAELGALLEMEKLGMSVAKEKAALRERYLIREGQAHVAN